MCPIHFFLMIFGDKYNERNMYLIEVLHEELGGFDRADSVVNVSLSCPPFLPSSWFLGVLVFIVPSRAPEYDRELLRFPLPILDLQEFLGVGRLEFFSKRLELSRKQCSAVSKCTRYPTKAVSIQQCRVFPGFSKVHFCPL